MRRQLIVAMFATVALFTSACFDDDTGEPGYIGEAQAAPGNRSGDSNPGRQPIEVPLIDYGLHGVEHPHHAGDLPPVLVMEDGTAPPMGGGRHLAGPEGDLRDVVVGGLQFVADPREPGVPG